MIISKTDLAALVTAKHTAPHSVLGMHPTTHKRAQGVVVRAFVRGADACEVIDLTTDPWTKFAMSKVAAEGVFEVFIPKRTTVFRYQLRASYSNAHG